MPLILRASKGSPLTHAEMDGNLTFLEESGLSTGYHAIWLPASAMQPDSVAGAAAAVKTGTHQEISCLQFDQTTVQYALAQVLLPESWDGSALYAKFSWTHETTTVNFLVKWGISATTLTAGSAWDITKGDYVYEVAEGGDETLMYRTLATAAITPSGVPAGGKLVTLRFVRDAGDAVYDTLNALANLFGVTLYYRVALNVDL